MGDEGWGDVLEWVLKVIQEVSPFRLEEVVAAVAGWYCLNSPLSTKKIPTRMQREYAEREGKYK